MRQCRPAFSLVEMMIAIIILGLGLVMVATMFPVAWTRARRLSETSTEQSIAAGANAIVANIVSPSTIRSWPDPANGNRVEARLSSAPLAGDLLFTYEDLDGDGILDPRLYRLSDNRVHVLNVRNYSPAAGPNPTEDELYPREDPWQLEGDYDPNMVETMQEQLPGRTAFDPQLPVSQRVYPPLGPPPKAGTPEMANWEDQLSRRRFALAVLHRLRSPVGPTSVSGGLTPEEVAALELAMGQPRDVEFYYVTLRRPSATNRYARQDATNSSWLPPVSDAASQPPSQPQARPADEDVAFPVAWRVEVEFETAPTAFKNPVVGASGPTGVPSEIRVPRTTLNAKDTKTMLAQMFPEGTRFIDERNGQVYRAAKRRTQVENNAEIAILTLDREIFVEDLDDGSNPYGGNGVADPEELVRVVWVFPPPVDRENSSSPTTPVFSGITPVINIDVRSMSLAPSL